MNFREVFSIYLFFGARKLAIAVTDLCLSFIWILPFLMNAVAGRQTITKMHPKVNQTSYLAQRNASVETIHKVVDINHELGVKCVEPFSQILPHRIQVFFARFKGAIRTSFQQNRSHCSCLLTSRENLKSSWDVIEKSSGFLSQTFFFLVFCFA